MSQLLYYIFNEGLALAVLMTSESHDGGLSTPETRLKICEKEMKKGGAIVGDVEKN